ncbi:MAG: hypothetical protein P8046_02290 [Anaerolineales bacterium]
MNEDRILQEAIGAIENGQRARARDLLTRLLRQDQARADYWLYMSAVVDSRKERIFCLENVLKADPENQTALQGLVMMGKRPPDDSRLPIRPVNERQQQQSEIFNAEGDLLRKRTFTRIPTAQMIALIMVSVVAVGLVLLTRPSATPEGGIPTQSGPVKPTALVIRVEETYTPTPAFVNTPHPNNESLAAALRSLNSGDYGLALALLEEARKNITDPTESDLDIRYYIGLAKIGLEDYKDAKRDFDLILLDYPRFAPAYLGRAQANLGMNPDAIVANDLYKAVQLEPEYQEAYLAIADYRYKRGFPEVTVEYADKLIAFAPDNPRAYYYKALGLLELNEFEDALDAAQMAFDLDPLMVDNYYTYGAALVENDRGQEGYGYLELYLRYEDNLENAMALYMFGRANQAFGFHEEALDYFKQAYAIRRDIYEMSYYWAVSLVATEDYEAALERVEVPLQRISDWFEPYVLQAQAYFYLDELENAREAIELGSTKAKTVPELAESYYWQAIIYGEMGFVVVARNNWTELTNLDPEQVPTAYLQEAREHLNTLPTATSDDQITPTRVISGTATPTPTSTSTATATATPSPSPTP